MVSRHGQGWRSKNSTHRAICVITHSSNSLGSEIGVFQATHSSNVSDGAAFLKGALEGFANSGLILVTSDGLGSDREKN